MLPLEFVLQIIQHGQRVADLKCNIGSFVTASEGIDVRRLRKALLSAAASTVETARDLNKLKAEHILGTLKAIAKALPAGKAA